MVGALDNRIGVSRRFGGGAAMSGAWEQDAAAGFVEELFAAHHGEIYAYLIRMLRDPELAADLTQDAFVKAYRNYDALEKPENARAWLYQIAHRVALDHIRRQKIVRFLPWTGESHGAAPSTERLVMDAHLSGDLQRALAKIPERQRAALLLAELHDLTGLELAAALGVSHVAARALLTRARESLRQALAAEREAEADAEAERRRPSRRGPPSRDGPMTLRPRPRRRPDDWPSSHARARARPVGSARRAARAGRGELAGRAPRGLPRLPRRSHDAYAAQRLELRALRDRTPDAAARPVGPDRGRDRDRIRGSATVARRPSAGALAGSSLPPPSSPRRSSSPSPSGR